MAIVESIPERNQSPSVQNAVINYCCRADKTSPNEHTVFVSGVNCVPDLAQQSFFATQKLYGHKSGTPRFYQYIQSFHPNEKVSPDTVHEIGLELAKAFGKREVIVATHIDREHIHNHFVVNSYDIETGKKLHSNKFFLAGLREKSDEICVKYGLSVLKKYDPRKKSIRPNSKEYRAALGGNSWKIKTCIDIDDCMRYAVSKDMFVELMRERGYEMTWTDTRKNITFIKDNRRVRDDNLHDEKYLKENIENELKIRERLFGYAQREEQTESTYERGGYGEVIGYDITTGRDDRGDENCGRDADTGGKNVDRADNREKHRTGWESERTRLISGENEGYTRRYSVDTAAYRYGGADGPSAGAVGLCRIAVNAASMFDNGDETEQERKEREARNSGALLGAAIGLVAGSVIAERENDDIGENDSPIQTL